jgi:ABC-type transporter MlaC component
MPAAAAATRHGRAASDRPTPSRVPAQGAGPIAVAERGVVHKTLKTLLSAIRHQKDDLAAQQIDFSAMAVAITGPVWGRLTGPQQAELVAGLEVVVRKVSFVRGRDIFQHLDAVRYGEVRMVGAQVHCEATVVVHKALKKTEIAIDFVLSEHDGKWRVMDTLMLGESTAQGIREDQVEPLVEDGGVAALLAALRKKVSELK